MMIFIFIMTVTALVEFTTAWCLKMIKKSSCKIQGIYSSVDNKKYVCFNKKFIRRTGEENRKS